MVILLGYGVAGNTTDFDSVVLGSNPSTSANNYKYNNNNKY